ncbi:MULTISPECIES: hypothetical protein [Brevibacillus]|jgi:hypothetical protein|uniref:hypothetical protein n=1 Tax=Brevibacillus TaxID=55080 RepID=UPI0004245A53|nr:MULTISPECIES: hypothetical protein [Brevibacillus]UYZ13509.1 hypothetical protein A6764_00465 [Brevibacillus sp. WF146]
MDKGKCEEQEKYGSLRVSREDGQVGAIRRALFGNAPGSSDLNPRPFGARQ